jgi:class 3 adenylate cyclase/tetratricopeptide (TPR) repeat protein
MSGPPSDPVSPDAAGQRRYLTLLFADLSGSTTLGEQMEAEDYAQMLANLRRLCREIVPHHGGLIARMQGDGVLALFGHPEPREDDGRRATEAALQLHAAVSALATRGPDGKPLTLHSGIHSGLVLISDGDVERGRFELLGNAPNVAARLSSQASADEVLVSEETLGPQARFFITGDIESVAVRGRATPLAVLKVLGRAAALAPAATTSGQRRLGPFVGRQGPVDQLSGLLDQPPRDQTICVALCGGPGLGKTRMVEELLRRPQLQRYRLLRGYCESYLSAVPLQPFVQIVRALQPLAEADAALAELCRLALTGGPEAVGRLFDLLARQGPLLLVIDDWQWADEASQRALDAILRLQRPIAVLLVSRVAPEQLATPPTVIELPPLGDEEAAAAVLHLLPQADPFLISEIQRYAGGIPLFIDELCHSVAVHGRPALSNLRGGGRAWLNVLVESRVERLPPEQAALVRTAAVLGNAFPAWLLERVSGHGADSPALLALADNDFVFPGERADTLRFKHGITRDAIYETVGLHERRRLHRDVARTLEAHGDADGHDGHFEALAYHCALGELWPAAARHAERAGERALAASALDRARIQYAAALHALDQTGPLDPEAQLHWCAITHKLGLACVFDPLALTDGLATFERGVALALASGDLETQARSHYWLGYVCYAKGLARPAAANCRQALELAGQIGDARLAAQVRATLGQVMLSACHYDDALVQLDAALQSQRRPTDGRNRVAVGPAYSLACKGYLLGDRGHFAGADECFAEALHLLGDMRHQVAASVRHWMSVVWQWQGRWDEALQAADEAATIAMAVKSHQQLAMGRALAGHARWRLAGDDQGLQAVRDATAWIESRRGGLATSLNHGWLVEGALLQGHGTEARRHAALLLLRARQDDRIGEALGSRALALAAAAAGDFDRAERWLRRAQRSAQIRGSAHEHAANLLCEIELAQLRGQSAATPALVDAAGTAFEAMRMHWHLRQLHRLADVSHANDPERAPAASAAAAPAAPVPADPPRP